MDVFQTNKDTVKEAQLIDRIKSGFLVRVVGWDECDAFQTTVLTSHDFEVVVDRKMVAIGEIRSRKYSTKYFEGAGWMLDKTKIEDVLCAAEERRVDVVFFCLHTSDDDIWILTGASLEDYLGSGMNDIAAYVIVLIVMMVRPYGLFGTKEIERV